MNKNIDCEKAYKLEKKGYAFCDTDELKWLADHIRIFHPEEWLTCKLNA